MIIRFLLLIFGLMLFAVHSVPGQTGYIEEKEAGKPQFAIDLATFRSENQPDKVRVELYYKICNDGLQYFKRGDEFVANYEINLVILGTDKSQVTGQSRERKYTVKSYAETRSSESFLVNELIFELPLGKYKVVCKLIDKSSGKVSAIEEDLKIESLYRNSIDMSDIEFVFAHEKRDTSSSVFDRGERIVVPAVTKVFNGEKDRVSFYAEIYNTSGEAADVTVKYRVSGRGLKRDYRDELPVTLSLPLTRLIKEIPTSELLPGQYSIEFELLGKDGKEIAKQKSEFVLSWSLKALIRNDFPQAVEQLKFIATSKEVEDLKKKPKELQEQAFDDFWASHDRFPETPENETREEYYRRVRHANDNFTIARQDGWRSDRGRIYIIFGEPDYVENYPFETDAVPYQVWYYYRLSRTFVFEDIHLNGDYLLRYPYDGRNGGLHETFQE